MNTIEFEPELQEEGKAVVKFTLRPFTADEFGELQYSMQRTADGELRPTYKATKTVFLSNVVGWEGLEKPYSVKEKNALLSGNPNWRLVNWMGAIAGKLYLHAVLTEEEQKN